MGAVKSMPGADDWSSYYGYVESAARSEEYVYALLDVIPSPDFDAKGRNVLEDRSVEHIYISGARNASLEQLREEEWLRLEVANGTRTDTDAHGIRNVMTLGEANNPQREYPSVSVRVLKGLEESTKKALTDAMAPDEAPMVDSESGSSSAWLPSGQAVSLIRADVGQANCFAFRSSEKTVLSYFDVGLAYGPNAETCTRSLQYCVNDRSLVVLSHWDFDHYSGCWLDPRLLDVNWLAPLQSGGKTFALTVKWLVRNGRLRWFTGQGCLVSPMGLIGKCSGRIRNDSGLAMRVELVGGLHVLLPGDCDYGNLPPALSQGAVGVLSVSHHGGTRAGPLPPKGDPGMALMSYGEGNTYGHPSRTEWKRLIDAKWGVNGYCGLNVLIAPRATSSRTGACGQFCTASWDIPLVSPQRLSYQKLRAAMRRQMASRREVAAAREPTPIPLPLTGTGFSVSRWCSPK